MMEYFDETWLECSLYQDATFDTSNVFIRPQGAELIGSKVGKMGVLTILGFFAKQGA